MITDPLFYAAAVPAVILVGLSKGGFAGLSTLSLPFLALVASPVQAAAIMLPILMVQDLVSLRLYWGKWDRTNLRRLLPGAGLGIALAAALAARISDAALQIAIGALSIGFGLRFFLRPGVARAPAGAGVAGGWFWGGCAGFASMIANAGQPPFQIYVMPQRLERDVFVGTAIMFFAAVNWAKAAALLLLGQVSATNISTSAVLVPIAIAATYGGVFLVRRIATERFYPIIHALLVAVGLVLVWNGAR